MKGRFQVWPGLLPVPGLPLSVKVGGGVTRGGVNGTKMQCQRPLFSLSFF